MISENCMNVSCALSLNASHESSETRLIPLTQGYFALVDAADWLHLTQFAWHLHSGKKLGLYAGRHLRKGEDGWKDSHHMVRRTMSAELLGHRSGMVVDHKNRNSLDYRRTNLRWATPSQNNQNKTLPPPKSGYRGVEAQYDNRRFRARIRVDGRLTHLGTFDTAREAAVEYNAAALKHYGEFACLNPID